MQHIIDQLDNYLAFGKHLMFFYLIFSCSIGLPSLVVLIIALLKSRWKALTYMIYFLLAKTVELIYGSYVEYQHANIPNGFQNYEIMIIYGLESLGIIFLPLLVNELFAITHRRKINYIFSVLFIVGLALIIVPYFLGIYRELSLPSFLQKGISIESLISYKIYRGIFWAAHLYAFLIVISKIKIVNDLKERNFYIGVFTILFVIVLQTVIPVFKNFPENLFIPVTGFFYINMLTLKYIVERFFVDTNLFKNFIFPEITTDTPKLTEREKEVLVLLKQGLTNKNIGDLLCISETTVKSHIQNIYKKAGVNNRVQLINSLKNLHE
jgi:DNA-binding CsgD family transcriptional regulator